MKIKLFLIVLSFALIASCSTIFTGSTQKVSIVSEPSEATITITDDSTSMQVFNGETPAVAVLKKGDGYFSGASYTVTVAKPGYKNVNIQIVPRMTGWYLAGNILVGGLVGWLIIDPLTGGMWTLSPKTVNAELKDSNLTINENQHNTISIVLLSDLDSSTFNSMPLKRLN